MNQLFQRPGEDTYGQWIQVCSLPQSAHLPSTNSPRRSLCSPTTSKIEHFKKISLHKRLHQHSRHLHSRANFHDVLDTHHHSKDDHHSLPGTHHHATFSNDNQKHVRATNADGRAIFKETAEI
jgi:hypothetical protein